MELLSPSKVQQLHQEAPKVRGQPNIVRFKVAVHISASMYASQPRGCLKANVHSVLQTPIRPTAQVNRMFYKAACKAVAKQV